MTTQYRRMAKAIRYIEDNIAVQPGLEQIAAHIGLSPAHFQRQFRQWAGVSPKRYLQFLTIRRARALLRDSSSVLDAALEVGLSGPGRLHDLFVAVDAVTPGQYGSGGAGVTVRYGFARTPFGNALIGVTDRGLSDLWFVEEEETSQALDALRLRWPSACLLEDGETAHLLAGEIFRGLSTGGEGARIRLLLRGTNFQIKVWQALLEIPSGTVVSYTDLAEHLGRPAAVRAVAGAVARNPIAWLIPCHRVLRRSGDLGGYRWGTARKRLILAREMEGKDRLRTQVVTAGVPRGECGKPGLP